MDDHSETAASAGNTAVSKSDTNQSEGKANPETLTTIINLLEPLSSELRQRTVTAAMMFLGEAPLQKPREQDRSHGKSDSANGDDEDDYPPHITKWMRQYDVSGEKLDQVFHFNADGTFDLLHAPGATKKDQTLNTYTLTGLGRYLSTNERTFDDATARGFCEKMGCLDASNHAATLKSTKTEFTGDKGKGYTLTNPGIKRGAELVKEAAGG